MASLPPSIRIARRITETVLTTWGVPPKTSVHDDAVLAVTEPATNTIRHAALLSPSFELILDVIDDHLDMAVRDSHSGPIELPSREGEGGLAVLADLAHGFGGHLAIEPGGGKTIHVTLPLTDTATTQETP